MEDFLRNEYEKLNSTALTVTGKCNILNNIVQLKFQEPELVNYKNDISVDIKKYLISIIDVAELGAKNYDTIKDEKIAELVHNLNKTDKVIYIDYWIRQLQKSSFDDEVKKFQKLKTKILIGNAVNDVWHLKSWLQLFAYIPIYNVCTLIITLIIIAFVSCVVLLPAPNDFMGIFNYNIEYTQFSDNFYINHFTNIISSLVGVNSDFKIESRDFLSQFALIVAKVFIFIYVITVLLNKLSDLIKR